MKSVWRLALACSVLAVAVPIQATSCNGVVQATLDEMRAGAGQQWTTEMAATVRAAAGAACIKALSGRYATASDDAAVDGAVDAAGERASTDGERAAAAPDGEESGGLWPFNGAGVRSITGSPAKKPYERRRGD